MSSIEIYDMRDKDDEYLVGTCTHVNGKSEHIRKEGKDFFTNRRIARLRNMHEKRSRVMIASINGQQVGFLHYMPIEICPWGAIGQELMVSPCLSVIGQ